MKKKQVKYGRGKNPNSHKGGAKVSEYERALTGTSTHAKTAKVEYKDFDFNKLVVEPQEKYEQEHPYKVLYCSFYRLYPGETQHIYDTSDKPVDLFWEVQHFKNLKHWKSEYKKEAQEATEPRTDSMKEYTAFIIDSQTGEILSKPDQEIRGWLPDPNDEVEAWFFDFFRAMGLI